MAPVYRDAGPRVAARQQPVRVAHVLVFDREGVRRLTPLPLREDERRGLARAGPVAHRRSQPLEQRIVHCVTDEQRVHLGAGRDVCPACPGSVQQQRHQPLAEGAGDVCGERVNGQFRSHRSSPPFPLSLREGGYDLLLRSPSPERRGGQGVRTRTALPLHHRRIHPRPPTRRSPPPPPPHPPPRPPHPPPRPPRCPPRKAAGKSAPGRTRTKTPRREKAPLS